MIKYKHLSLVDREEISRYLIIGFSCRKIASILRRSPSSICREINRTSFCRLRYRAVSGYLRSRYFVHVPRRKRKLDINSKLQRVVIQMLHKRWSPEQIAKRLKLLYPDDMTMRISHETIYAYIYVHPRQHLKRKLLFQLRQQHKYRRPRNKERQKSYPIQDYLSITERPSEANHRKIAGHWEGDLVMGAMNKSAIGTLVERTTRMTFIVHLKNKDASSVCEAFTQKMNRLPEKLKKSLTYDHGCEMAEHKQFTKNTKIKVYFAHPHSPWERGTSENTNALIRDFFKRGTDFSKITAHQLKKVENLLNDRPRKVLGFLTPRETFTKIVALKT